MVEKSQFIGNRSTGTEYNAGAIKVGRDKGVILRENKFADNQGSHAGAILFQNSSENEVIASTFSGNKGNQAGGIYFRYFSKDNVIEKSNFVGHGGLAVNADVDTQPETEDYTPYTSSGNTVNDTFIAGNNGAADGVVDVSNGTTSTAVPPQWQNVTVTNARSTTNGEAPRPPLQLKDITVSADASAATATLSWTTEAQANSIVQYGTAAPETGAVEWTTTSGGNGHF